MKSGLLLNVVVRQSTSIFQLLASKDQSLLVRRNSLLILDLGLYIFYCIRGLDLESDGLPRQGLHENLHLGGGSTADGGSESHSSILAWRSSRTEEPDGLQSMGSQKESDTT